MAVDLICVTCETKVSVSEVAATRHKRCHVCGDPLVPLSAAQPQPSAAPAAGVAPVALPPPARPRQQIAPPAAPAPPRGPAPPAINFGEEFERVVNYTLFPGPYVHLRRSGIPPQPLWAHLADFARNLPPEQVTLLVDVTFMGYQKGFVLTSEYCHFHVPGVAPGQGGHFWLRDVVGAARKDRGEILVHLTYGHQPLEHPIDAELAQRLVQMFDQVAAINRRQPPPPTSFGPVAPWIAQRFPPTESLLGIPKHFYLRQRGLGPEILFFPLYRAPPGIAPRDVLAIYWNDKYTVECELLLFTSRGLAVCFGDGRRMPIPYGQLAGAALGPAPHAAYFEVVLKNGLRLRLRQAASPQGTWQLVQLLCEIGRMNLPADRMIEPG